MLPQFIPYEDVPLGFEIARADKWDDIPNELDWLDVPGYSFDPSDRQASPLARMAVWWNIRMVHPKDWDEEIQMIHRYQRELGNLSRETRSLRVQIATINRCHYTFPKNLDQILKGIGQGKPNYTRSVGCESPWHPALDSSRNGEISRYHKALLAWLKDRPPENETATKIFEWLGERTELKELYVRRLDIYFQDRIKRHINDSLKDHPEGKKIDEKIFALTNKYTPHPEQDAVFDLIRNPNLKRRIKDPIFWHLLGLGRGTCHFNFFRYVDRIIQSIGLNSWLEEMPKENNFRHTIIKAKAYYLYSLDSWLEQEAIVLSMEKVKPYIKQMVRMAPRDENNAPIMTYDNAERELLTENELGEVMGNIYEWLGDRSQTKKWLVMCLWKTLKHNMIWTRACKQDIDLSLVPNNGMVTVCKDISN